jgi:hypothetical protein
MTLQGRGMSDEFLTEIVAKEIGHQLGQVIVDIVEDETRRKRIAHTNTRT